MRQKGVIVGAGAVVLATAVALQARTRPAAEAEATAAVTAERSLRFSRVRLNTGVELHLAELGPADGKPVLFLHGFPDSWFSYSTLLDRLPAGIRAIVPSQRGHGDSDRPACCYRVADFARDAVALLDALAITRADLVGHSMGSFVAQRIAIEHPERVDRLVLIGSANTAATPPVVEFNQEVQKLTDPIALSFAREFQVSTAHQPLPAPLLDELVSESMKPPAHVWRAVLGGLVAADARHDLTRIRSNCLLLWGEHDDLFGKAEQQALLQAMPNARLVAYAGLGHSPHWEDPARVLADLSNFLSTPSTTANGGRTP